MVMHRWTLLALGLLSVAIAIVALVSASRMSDERSRLVDEFARERLETLKQANESIVAGLADVDQDLRFVAEMVEALSNDSDRTRVLTPLLAVVKPYRLIQIFDEHGTRMISVVDPTWGPDAHPEIFDNLMSEAAASAFKEPPGHVSASHGPANEAASWFRAFSVQVSLGEQRAAITLLVDTEPYFQKLSIVAGLPATRLLVIGPHGLPTPPSDPLLRRAIQRFGKESDNLPMSGVLAKHLREGDSGTMVISEPEAEALGLGQAELVAAFAPIQMRSAGRYQVAALASTSALKAQARANMLRLLLTSGTIGLLIAGFGAYTVVAQTRAIELRERVKSADRVAHLHEKADKILDRIPAGVAVLSKDIEVTALNRAFRDTLNDPSGPVPNAVDGIFPRATAEVVSRIREILARALETQRTVSIIGEPLGLRGVPGRYSVHAVPLEPRFPEARLLLFVEDLSQVELLTEQLLRAEKHATVGVIAAGVAHEIGTPLGVARARAEFLMKTLGPGHPQIESTKVIVEQIDLVSRTIRQLLDFSRVQSPAVRPTPVLPVANAVRELLRFEAERRKVNIEVAAADGVGDVAADPDQLQQVLVNIALNACDACAARTDGGHVKISIGRDESAQASPSGAPMVRIAVEDDGCGIPPENKNQIFDPFFTTKKRGQGTGLGLTMVSQIVRDHRARIEIDSEVGRGTRVVILWPGAA